MSAQDTKKTLLVSSCSILALGYLTVLLFPATVERFSIFSIALFSLACAGLASFLPGSFTWKGRGMSGGGALGIFIFLFWWLKPSSQPALESSFMIRVVVEKDKLIPEDLTEGYVILMLGNEPRKAPVLPGRDALFEHIPSQYLGTLVKFGILFDNKYTLKRPDSLYKLENDRLM